MVKILNWILNHKIKVIFIIVSIILLPLLIIHVLFKINSNCYWIEAEWQAGEVLGYCGDILSFIGTIVLGYIAILQSEKANKMNNELLRIEKNKIKPCLNISPRQLYSIYFNEDMVKKFEKIDRNSAMIMYVNYFKEQRTGNNTLEALIELQINNSGFSDIKNIYIENIASYLAVTDPYNKVNECANFSGDVSLKQGKNKKLYILFKHEISSDEELSGCWYSENTKYILPHMELELKLETTIGNSYIERIAFGSNWDISMKNEGNTIKRSIGVSEISVDEIVDEK